MPALSRPDTITGPLTAADLDAARQHSTGRVFYLRRAHIAGRDTCTGQCETHSGCDCVQLAPAEACTDIGHDDSAVESMLRHRRTRSTVGLAVLLGVLGYLSHIVWPLLGA